MNFADLDQVAPDQKFDFILADLGVSSMQIDNPERGFTFKYDGPLDLRLDPTTGVTAAQRLRELDREELAAMLVENSDEPYADEIAKAIITVFKKRGTIETTRQLADVIEQALSFLPVKERKEAVKKSCQRTFQALRIEVNSELSVLADAIPSAMDALRVGGRIAIMSYQSLEDRLVKQAFTAGSKSTAPAGLPVELPEHAPRFKVLTKGAELASEEERARNPRAIPVRLRAAEKIRESE